MLQTLPLHLVLFFQVFHLPFLLALCTAVALRAWLAWISFRKRTDIPTTPISPPTPSHPPTNFLCPPSPSQGGVSGRGGRSLKSTPGRIAASSGPTPFPPLRVAS